MPAPREKFARRMGECTGVREVIYSFLSTEYILILCFRWLYALILTIDANFRLKLKDRGLKADPPLGDGWGHLVKTEPYLAYVNKYGYQVEVCRFQHNGTIYFLTFYLFSLQFATLNFEHLTTPRHEHQPLSKLVVLVV